MNLEQLIQRAGSRARSGTTETTRNGGRRVTRELARFGSLSETVAVTRGRRPIAGADTNAPVPEIPHGHLAPSPQQPAATRAGAYSALLRPREPAACADLWCGGNTSPEESKTTGLPTGIPGMEAVLPGGWPRGALTEILIPAEGIGELGLVMPALAWLSHSKRWLAWVAPPHIPYAPALVSAGVDLSRVMVVRPRSGTDGLWAVEQTLRAGTCGAVLAWLTGTDTATMRRLQLAAEAGNSWGVLFRPQHMASQASPAALRLRLEPTSRGLAVQVLKRRGGWATGPVYLNKH